MPLQTEPNKFIREREVLDSKWVFEVVNALITSAVIDEVAKTKDFFKSRQSKWLIDASHLSHALHCFVSAKRQNISLINPDNPPISIDLISRILSDLMNQNDLNDETKTRTKYTQSIRSKLVTIFKQILNQFVLLRVNFFSKSKLYGGLYNIEPRITLSSVVRIIWYSIRFGLVRIECLRDNSKLTPHSTAPSVELRNQLQQKLEYILECYCELPSTSKDLSSFLSKVIPISHLENRSHYFQWGVKLAKHLGSKSVYSANGYADSAVISILAAASKEFNGAQIIGIQHGGFYGYCNVHSHAFNTEYQFLDKFVTWGWDNCNNTLGQIPVELVPLGSSHLQKIIEKSRTQDYRHSGHPRVLFVEGSFPARFIRCEYQYDFEKIKSDGFELNAKVLVSMAKDVGAEIYMKGGQDAAVEQIYFDIIKNEAGKSNVTCHILNPALRAYDIYRDYDIICFDTVGTGFLESTSKSIPTFLLPTAAYSPIRRPDAILSNLLFLKENEKYSMESLKSSFHKAMKESQSFFNTYAKPSKFDFLELQKLL